MSTKNVFLFVLLALPFVAFAQPKIQIGAGLGSNIIYSLKNKDIISSHSGTYYQEIVKERKPGYSFTVKGLVAFKMLEVGAAIETGSVVADLKRIVGSKEHLDEVAQLQLLPSTIGNNVAKGSKVASFYATPNVFVHFKVNIGGKASIFIGPTGGRMFSSNHMTLDGKSSSWVAGGNLGAAVGITDRLSVDIVAGWRNTWVKNEKPKGNRWLYQYNDAQVDTDVNVYMYSPTDRPVGLAIYNYNFSYIHTNIGVRYTL